MKPAVRQTLTLLSLILVNSSLAQSTSCAESIEPRNAATAIKYSNLILEELDRAQQDLVGRHDPERVACYFFGQLASLYDIKSEVDASVSVLQFDGNGHELPPSIRTLPIQSFTNPNIDAITICRPNQIPSGSDRKNAISALKTEVRRLSGN